DSGAQIGAQIAAPTGVFSGREQSSSDASRRNSEICNPFPDVALSHEKASGGVTERLPKMVGAERFELSTSWSQTRRSTRLSDTPGKPANGAGKRPTVRPGAGRPR